MKIHEINIEDMDFPEKLRRIKNPPKKIYVVGNKEILNQDGIAVIGSRNCTEEGIRNARIFSESIAKAGFTIISGMAKGIDTAGHMRSVRSESVKQLLYLGVEQMLYIQRKIMKYIKG